MRAVDDERLPAWRDPHVQAPFALLLSIVIIGTVFYRLVEGWDVLDALYFSIVTLATVGYGDFTPHTAPGKIFTMVYIIVGIGLLAAFAQAVGRRWVDRRIRKITESEQRAAGPRRQSADESERLKSKV